MLMNTKLTGSWGEALAADFLKNNGYTLVSMGYRCRLGEIDIIARDKKYIVFVEVKLRKNDKYGRPGEAVGGHKIARLKSTAEIWLGTHDTDLQPRFDVIEIIAPLGVNTKNPEITHLEDVF